MTENLPVSSEGNFLFYQSEDGTTRVRVVLDAGTVWLSQRLIAELYDTTPQNVTQHIRSIYDDGELLPKATCKEYLQVQSEGTRQVQRRIVHYNLDVILAVGYRVRSPRGT